MCRYGGGLLDYWAEGCWIVWRLTVRGGIGFRFNASFNKLVPKDVVSEGRPWNEALRSMESSWSRS